MSIKILKYGVHNNIIVFVPHDQWPSLKWDNQPSWCSVRIQYKSNIAFNLLEKNGFNANESDIIVSICNLGLDEESVKLLLEATYGKYWLSDFKKRYQNACRIRDKSLHKKLVHENTETCAARAVQGAPGAPAAQEDQKL